LLSVDKTHAISGASVAEPHCLGH